MGERKCVVCGKEDVDYNFTTPTDWICNECDMRGRVWAAKEALKIARRDDIAKAAHAAASGGSGA
jgi:hypothetical protein